MDEMKKIEQRTDTNRENAGNEQERAASLVEYVLLVVLIALAAVVVLQLFGQTVSQKFSEINSELKDT
jgi:Flp pilus assembly pilin Flp